MLLGVVEGRFRSLKTLLRGFYNVVAIFSPKQTYESTKYVGHEPRLLTSTDRVLRDPLDVAKIDTAARAQDIVSAA